MDNEVIRHSGEIIELGEGIAKVKIIQTSACAECMAKGMCTASDKTEKIIEAEANTSTLSVGETVWVEGHKNLGIIAVLFAYIMPFLLILLTMVIASQFTENELLVGTISLLILIPYFIVIRCMKGRFKAKFKFYVVK